MKIVFVSFFIMAVNCSFSQQVVGKKKLSGLYSFYNDDSTVRYFLELKDQEYFYSKETELYKKDSKGHWRTYHDTLYLTSNYQPDDIGLLVKEIVDNSDRITFSPIENIRGQPFNALICINNDTSRFFDPIDTKYIIPKGSVRAISVFVGNGKSRTYIVKDRKTTKFSITLNVDQLLEDYVYFQNKKFLLSDNLIFPLQNNNKPDSILMTKDVLVPIALAKIR